MEIQYNITLKIIKKTTTYENMKKCKFIYIQNTFPKYLIHSVLH